MRRLRDGLDWGRRGRRGRVALWTMALLDARSVEQGWLADAVELGGVADVEGNGAYGAFPHLDELEVGRGLVGGDAAAGDELEAEAGVVGGGAEEEDRIEA